MVAPGFIDMLGQSEESILVNPHLPSKIYQGITTEITGEGGSAAPLTDAIRDRPTAAATNTTKSTRRGTRSASIFARLEKQGMGINLASYVGATQVRRAVIGDGDRAPTPAELEQMKALVRDAMRDGAVGVSTSLQYAPAPYATTEELIALAAEGAKLGGIYATHMRSEGDAIIPAIDEAIRIGREAHVPVEIWHLKAAGRQNWGRMPEIVAHIDEARRSGVEIGADTYAYHCLVQQLLGIHSAVGARWRRRQAHRAPERPGHARPHPQRHADAQHHLGQRVARDPGPGGHPAQRGAEPASCCRCKARPSRRSRSSGTRTPSTPSSTS